MKSFMNSIKSNHDERLVNFHDAKRSLELVEATKKSNIDNKLVAYDLASVCMRGDSKELLVRCKRLIRKTINIYTFDCVKKSQMIDEMQFQVTQTKFWLLQSKMTFLTYLKDAKVFQLIVHLNGKFLKIWS